jgi:hypothetical protein
MDPDEWTLGYDLDGGGYEFEAPANFNYGRNYWHRHTRGKVVLWDSPDLDYVGLQDEVRQNNDWPDLLVCGVADFPTEYVETDDDGDVVTHKRIAQGVLHGGSHECSCYGKLDVWTGAAGEPDKPESIEDVRRWLLGDAGERIWNGYIGEAIVNPEALRLKLDRSEASTEEAKLYWVFSGNPSDLPYPKCDRCRGDGYVDVPGGSWALYTRHYGD